MKKLTHEEARLVLAKAFKDTEKYTGLRMGQAIWNLMPAQIALSDIEHPSHAEWYNSADSAWCIKRFFNDLVEK